jgi:rSAM/selenodomain-associated transferase 1
MLVRDPVPGRAKTRLVPALGREGAAALYRAFTEDLCAVLGPRFPMALACDPVPEGPWLTALARRHGLALVPQGSGDLGARMRRIAGAALERAARVVLVGSDAPTLPPERVSAAFRALRTARVVIGPSLDGGYYLLGLRAPLPPIFTRMPWGGAGVLARTLRRLRAARVRPALLPCWYDVDTPADLGLLQRELAVRGVLSAAPCPRTRRALARLARPATRVPTGTARPARRLPPHRAHRL